MAIVDRSVQYPGRYILTPVAGLENGYNIVASPGTVYATGTLLNRALFLSLAPIQVFDTVVQPAAWVEDSTYASLGFYYRASIAIATAAYLQIPAVTFNPTDALTKRLCPVAVSYTGGIYIYAKRALTEAITIPTIELTRPTSSI